MQEAVAGILLGMAPPWHGPPSNQENGGWLEASAQEVSTKSNLVKVQLLVYKFDSIRTFCTSADGVSRQADNLLQQICQHRSSKVRTL